MQMPLARQKGYILCTANQPVEVLDLSDRQLAACLLVCPFDTFLHSHPTAHLLFHHSCRSSWESLGQTKQHSVLWLGPETYLYAAF